MLLLCLTKKSSDFPICFDSSYNLSVACVSSLRWMDNFSGERIALRSKTRIWIRSHNSLSHIHGRCEKSIHCENISIVFNRPRNEPYCSSCNATTSALLSVDYQMIHSLIIVFLLCSKGRLRIGRRTC